MRHEVAGSFIRACQLAKKITQRIGDLPDGVTPSNLMVIERLHDMDIDGKGVRIGDISDALGVRRPGMTRTVGELVASGYMNRKSDPNDGRVVLVQLTPKGERVYHDYVLTFEKKCADLLEGVGEERLSAAAETIRDSYKALAPLISSDPEDQQMV